MNWDAFYTARVQQHSDQLDNWDITILKAVVTRWPREEVVLVDIVKRYVVKNIGFISDQDLHDRLNKLEDLGLITRKIGLGLL